MKDETSPTPAAQLRELGARISPTQRFWLATLVIVLATFFLGSTLIQTPWEGHRRQMVSRISNEKQRIELLQTLNHQGETLQESEQGLLLEGGAPVLTSHLSRIAKESGVEIESVTPQPQVSLPPYIKFQIEITALAHLKDLVRLLHTLEHYKPLLVTDELEVGSPSTAAGAPYTSYGAVTPRLWPPSDAKERGYRVRLLIGSYARKEQPS